MIGSAVSFAILFFAFASARVEIPDDLKDYVDDLRENCMAQTRLTKEEHDTYDINVKNPKVMCYMKCLMIQSEWMISNETINYEFIINSTPQEVKPILLPALNKCREISEGTQACEKAYNFNVCLNEADPENWFLI